MADADFEIDFYAGAADSESQTQQALQEESEKKPQEPGKDDVQAADSGDRDGAGPTHEADEAAPHQGTKRKPEEAERPVDANATLAIMISEMQWWTTDDDVRGWMVKATSEDEIKDLTFSEHKVNGKSKGQAYVEFHSRQAATAVKHHLDQLTGEGAQPAYRKLTVSYWNPGTNPFRTLPKDAPARTKEQPRTTPSGHYNDRGNYGGGGGGGGYRGRGNYGGRGNNMGPGNNFNRNFTPNMGYNNNNNNPAMGGGFNGPMGGNNFGGFGGRGGNNMMGGGGMRGGMRGGNMGGRGGGMMPMGPMGGMPMGMPGTLGMMGMGGGMPGFPGMGPGFPGAFGFGQNQGGGAGGGAGNGDWGNPHGAKRPRPE